MRWLRLFHGRLWHVALQGVSYCGEATWTTPRPEFANTPPDNAWVCERCVAALGRDADEARTNLARDPRRAGDTP